MNNAKLKAYAPQARRDFIAAVTAQAAVYGLGPGHVEPLQQQGDVVLIGGRAFPGRVAGQRRKLEARIDRDGFERVMEAIAYTWFNRCVALRYMELHGYLEHGYRVLSPAPHPEGGPGAGSIPEILEQAEHVELPGLKRDTVIELKLDGTREAELYRLLLVAQCNALSAAMPFLFERIDDETELLLPDNLLRTDSVITQLVGAIPEEDWADIEIIGWLYQFYISEKKDQVIGKVVKSEDIPAATQLFTPNWIVKYMVQNSLGAQWLATYPDSPLKGQMEFYIEPAEQTDEVKAQLAAITPNHLNPEELTLIDPACGSGHTLVEAYELFRAIYLERGYRLRDIPRLILEKNLYGLDIDDRAAQLAGFALLMKARADDRRLFERGVKLNVIALQDSSGFDAENLAKSVDLGSYGLKPSDLTALKRLFEHATTFGSLIQVPEELAEKLPALKQISEAMGKDLFVQEALTRLGPLIRQAELLAAQYDAVVANPPYMGSKYQTPILKKYLNERYAGYEKDFFSAFFVRYFFSSKTHGRLAVVAPYVWMFISSYEKLRERLITETTLTSLIQLEYNAFEPACIPVATFTLMRKHMRSYTGSYIKLSEFKGYQNQAPRALEAINNRSCGWFYSTKPDDFKRISGSPIAYWMTDSVRKAWEFGIALGEISLPRKGNSTSDNNRFLRFWPEVCHTRIGLHLKSYSTEFRWIPYNKGGGFLKWYGHNSFLIDWQDQGQEIRQIPTAVIANESLFFQPGLTWGTITSKHFSIRWFDEGYIFDNGGCCIFGAHDIRLYLMALLNSSVFPLVIGGINPTLNFQSGDVAKFPVIQRENIKSQIDANALGLLGFGRTDWDAYERSWDFQSFPLITTPTVSPRTLESSYTAWVTQNRATTIEMKRLEEENNRLFIDAYGLKDEVTPDVPIEQITLTVNPAYRYGGNLSEAEQWTHFRRDTMQELISYAIGCMMGRYSLDEPGLIYALAGNVGFDATRYQTFPADPDGILPITDEFWFEDDAANRVREFLIAVWGAETLDENLAWLAESLGAKGSETPAETLRRYLASSFFKDHLQTYKKRPIYWLFSSGKQGAFQALVYLHRYHEGTLARMRTEYVIPLQGRMASRIEQLDGDIAAATSTAHAKQLQKQRDKLAKQRSELLAFDEKLRHYADQRITLDLDDGVKVNYGKFGDLLAEVKAVTGGKEDS